jgi:AraC-like DNA-binding protein
MSLTSGASMLLGFLLINHPQKVNRNANRWLGLFIITLGFAMLEMLLVSQDFHRHHPKYFEIIGISRFVTAPALYLAIRSFTSLNHSLKAKELWHFAPFLIILLFRLPFFISGKNIVFSPQLGSIIFFVLQIILPLQAVVYWMLSYQKLQKHLKDISIFSSVMDAIDLSWLKSFLLLLLGIIVVWLNLVYFDIDVVKAYTPLLYMAGIFFLAHYSLQQKEIFAFSRSEVQELATVITMANQENEGKTKRLNETRAAVLNGKLTTLMIVEKVFLENELSLPTLASKLDATSNETSYLINQLYGQNFYTFINTYRVEEAKKLLLSDEYSKLNILGIAYQSGFNSKTTFNTTFKKFTGVSPTEFIRQHQCK